MSPIPCLKFYRFFSVFHCGDFRAGFESTLPRNTDILRIVTGTQMGRFRPAAPPSPLVRVAAVD